MRCALLVLAVAALAVGCASAAMTQGQLALRQGRYVEAEGFFNEALAKDPGRTDALVGLGIAQYKGGLVDQAIESLEKASPSVLTSQACVFYLALAYLKREDTEKAEEQLHGIALAQDRLAGRRPGATGTGSAQAGSAHRFRRKFIVGSLETQAELSRDVHDARLQAQMAQAYYYAYYPYYPFAPFSPF